MAIIDTSKITIPIGFFEDLNVPKLFKWLYEQPAADVVPRDEVAKIFEEIEQELVAALESNYNWIREHNVIGNTVSESVMQRVYGKIDALRGIEGFIEELKEKYTKRGAK